MIPSRPHTDAYRVRIAPLVPESPRGLSATSHVRSRPSWARRAGSTRLLVVAGLTLVASGLAFGRFALNGGAPEPPGVQPEPARGTSGAAGSAAQGPQEFIEGDAYSVVEDTHQRITFDAGIDRIAVGNDEVLDVTTLSDQELLVLGKRAGRTSLIVWLKDNTIQRVDVVVERDLSILEAAIHDVFPGIEVSIAPDRDAVVLTGTVPYAIYSRRAEAVARAYIEAQDFTEDLLVGDAASGVAEQQSLAGGRRRASRGGQVINLIRIEGIPDDEQGLSPEQKIIDAIQPIGGERVTVRRIVRGDVPNDVQDVLILEGTVRDQVVLTRVLSLAYKIFVGSVAAPDRVVTDGVAQTTTTYESEDLAIGDDIKVIGDESGSLLLARQQGGAGSSSQNLLQGFGNSGGGGGGGGGGQSGIRNSGLNNLIEANIARATALELGDGRILSFIDVEDLPQVVVDIRIYEVNRNALMAWRTDNNLILSSFDQPSLDPALGATRVQGDMAARVGAAGNTDVQNVLGFFGGALSNQLQISGSSFAIDSLINLLEDGEIVRGLAATTLSVLSGEFGIFEVGGQVPIDQSFATAAVGSTGVFNSVTFINFGVKLAVRPLVGENDFITIDFVPEITTPDALLTAALTELTGSPPQSFAFESRLLKTSSRLKDGYTLLVGGLDQKNRQDRSRQTPWLSRIPLLGALFQDFSYSDDDLQVVVLIRPSIVRDPIPNQALWSFPDTLELLDDVLPEPPPQEGEEGGGAEGEEEGADDGEQPAAEDEAGAPEAGTASIEQGGEEQSQ